MNVLFISVLYRSGGAERIAREWLEQLPSLGIQTEMLVARRYPDDPPNVSSVRLPGEKFLRFLDHGFVAADWRFFGSKIKLRRLKSSDYDLIHLHNSHGSWISRKSLQALSMRMPLIWSLHDETAVKGVSYDLDGVMTPEQIRATWPGWNHIDPTSDEIKRIKAYGSNWPLKPAALMAHSNHVFSLVQQSDRWKGVPLYHVRFGVSLQENPACQMDRLVARRRWGIEPNEKVVLLIAHHLYTPYKGMPFAVKALRRLKTPCRVILVGDGGEELAAKLSQKSICTGLLRDPVDLAAAYRAADVMLFPSLAEAFGLVGAEAMACQTPVVGFRLSGLIELVGNNERGLLASPLDDEEMAANIQRLFDDPALANQLGSAGQRWVAENFRAADSVRAVADVYRQVLANLPQNQTRENPGSESRIQSTTQ